MGLAGLADRYVCVSNDVRAQCAAEGIRSARLMTILNGIDLGRFESVRPDPAGPVSVARLSPESVANLVRAAAIAANRAARFRVEVGRRPCLDELKQLAANLDVSDRVTFLGEVRDIPANCPPRAKCRLAVAI